MEGAPPALPLDPVLRPEDPARRPGQGFGALLAVRGLTLVNDHALKWLSIGLGKRLVDEGNVSLVLTVGLVGLSLPYVLFSGLAGALADSRSKTSVVRWCKAAEVAIVSLAAVVVAFSIDGGREWMGLPTGLWLLLLTVMAIGVQAAVMTPALVGSISEIVSPDRLASANGLFALASLISILAGTAAGNWVADATPLVAEATPWERGVPTAALLLGTALAGWIASLCLPRLPAVSADADGAAIPSLGAVLRSTWNDLALLFSRKELVAAASGIVFFWAIGAVAQANVDQFATEAGATSQGQIVPLLVALVVGIGTGSVVTGKLATRPPGADPQVDLGFVPLGGLIMAAAFAALACTGGTFVEFGGAAAWLPMAWLVVLGFGAGMFDVPLETHLQARSPADRLGGVLAVTNLLLFSGMFLASLGYGALRAPLGPGGAPFLSARAIFALFSALSLVAALAAVWCAPRATLRLAVAAIVHAAWRFRVAGLERVPKRGPSVVVGNHVSWLDGFLLPLAIPRSLRMVVYGPNIRGRFLRMLADQWRFILFEPSPKSIGRALKEIQAGLAEGDAVGIFSEGGISRTGQLLGFKRGLEWVLERAAAPVVPAFIDGMWGSLLSFSEGRFFSKWPRFPGWRRRRVTLWFATPLPEGTPPREARIAIQDLSTLAVRDRLATESLFDRRLGSWRRRHAARAGDRIAGAISALARGAAIDPGGAVLGVGAFREGAVVAGPQGVTLDRAALLATAEAFDGCCVVRRGDRLLSSLAPGDPLFVHLGLLGGPLLGIAATAVDADAEVAAILRRIASDSMTIWVARVGQVQAAASSSALPGTTLEAVVMPIASAADLPAALEAAAAFAAAHGVEPVVAFAPGPLGGLVAMNTPPLRAEPHERVCRIDALGRVVVGVAVWPVAHVRATLGRDALEEGLRAFGPPCPDPAAEERTLVVAATAPRRDAEGALGSRLPGWFLVDDPVWIDEDGFVVPGSGPRGDDAAPGGSRADRRRTRGRGAAELG